MNDIESPELQTGGTESRMTILPQAPNVFVCDLCVQGAAVFSSSKALQAHKRSKHGVRSAVIEYIPDTCVCPVCQVDFRSRLRLVTHASNSRVRSKTRQHTCRDVILSGILPKVPIDELGRLNARDRDARRAASKAGHSHEIARLPARKP